MHTRRVGHADWPFRDVFDWKSKRPFDPEAIQPRRLPKHSNDYRLTIVTSNHFAKIMSLKHVLLALLTQAPTHGYELKKRYDEALGTLWPLQQAQMYNNLRLLEKADHIVLDTPITQENLPEQKVYCVTEAGAAELAVWISTPVPSSRQRKDDLYLKLSTLASI